MSQMSNTTKYALVAAVLIIIIGSALYYNNLQVQKRKDREELEARIVPSIEYIMHGPATHPERYEVTHNFAENIKLLGLAVEESPLDFMAAVTIQRMSPWDYDIGTGSWLSTAARIDPDVLLWVNYHSSQTVERGSNMAGLEDAELDQLLEAQKAEYDLDARQEIVYAIQERVAELISTIPLFHHKAVQFYNHETFSNWPVIQGSDLVNQISITEIVPLTGNKVVNIGSDEPTDGFSPFDASAQISIDLMFLYGRILQYKPEGGLQGDQAESWKAVDDTTIEVTLRNGLTFHDGVPLTADDVAFTFNYIKDWEIPVYAGLIEAIESVEAVDADTVVFNLKYPTATLYSTTFTLVPILPDHIWMDVVENEGLSNPQDWNNPEPIGSGPMKMVDWNVGESVVWETFENYWKPINVEGAVWVEHLNVEGKFLSLKAKTIDAMIEPISISLEAEARELDYLTEIELLDIGVPYAMINMRRYPGADLAYRQALAHSYEWDYAVDVVFRGEAYMGSNMIARSNVFWNNPDADFSELFEFDIDLARQILADAGYEWDDEGRLLYPEALMPLIEAQAEH